ncbi:MAG TPA: 50S ribosomal protein L4 [Vicinamibacterales bacterium]|nr:50S ribosomal protein L4 [Vicinamibacterales bacterium]
MELRVVNAQNEPVGSIALRDDVFGGPVKTDLIWEAVVHEQACARRGTHATKNRALVSGSGRKPWRQKGTGRARVGEIRNPLWRKGGTVFGPQPRSYAYRLPRKVARGALRAALTQKLREGAVTVIDAFEVNEPKTRAAAELLARLGATGRTLLVDVAPAPALERSTRNLPGVRLVAANRLTARDVAGAARLVATRAAIERLEAALA